VIDTFAYILLALSLLLLFGIVSRVLYRKILHTQRINKIFNLQTEQILSEEETKKREDFKLKLLQASMTQKQFNEIVLAAILSGASLIALIFIVEFSFVMNVFLIFMGVSIAIFMPFLYLEEQRKARIKRIENDLAIFIDLLIIILEGGGGLNNAIDKVTQEASGVLGKDLLEESITFKNEFITYGSEVAYNNLAQRTGSEAIAALVGFMRLSEETGIGVKTIFENQSKEIKAAELLTVEKKAATMNISITLVMFLFIIPSVIAMIAFPLASGALMSGF